MAYLINPISPEDREPIMQILNYYVENTFAAYPEDTLPLEVFDLLFRMTKDYPTGTIKDQDGNILGFGMFRPHSPIPTFSKTVDASYFIHPDHIGKGLGKQLLAYLENKGRDKGVTCILANISSLNPKSIAFHKKNGFTECGCFKNVGKKKGCVFDTVWMQKMIIHEKTDFCFT